MLTRHPRYIENESNNTLAPFSKRSVDEEKSLSKRASAPPEASLDSLYAGFQEEFNLTRPEVSYAVWPNPFNGIPGTGETTKSLRLVDGSENGQQIPLWSLIQPERDLDFIIAFEATEDAAPYVSNFPKCASVIARALRVLDLADTEP